MLHFSNAISTRWQTVNQQLIKRSFVRSLGVSRKKASLPVFQISKVRSAPCDKNIQTFGICWNVVFYLDDLEIKVNKVIFNGTCSTSIFMKTNKFLLHSPLTFPHFFRINPRVDYSRV